MAYTESKAYDLRNVQYQGTRIGGIDQITTPPIQYQGTPVTFVQYRKMNIMHRYVVRNGNGYTEEWDYDDDEFNENVAGVYSVSSTHKDSNAIQTDIPAPEPYSDRTITYRYNITKWELTRTSGDKNESKYYLYAFTIALRAYSSSLGGFLEIRTDKYDYLSTEDISLDTLAAQIEDPSGGTEGFTPPWKLNIPTADILKRTQRERERTDELKYTGNFDDFLDYYQTEEGTTGSWGPVFDYSYYHGIFNQAAEDLIVHYYMYSPSSSLLSKDACGRLFNFKKVVDSKSLVDNDHVYISHLTFNNDYSSCYVDSLIDTTNPVIVTDNSNVSYSSDDFEHFSLIFLICSSCSNFALSDGLNKIELSYRHVDHTKINANVTYNNSINRRDY